MKKTFIIPLLAVLLAAAATSCTKNGNNNLKPELPEAPMLASAARYETSDPDAIVKSLVLTEGGTYTILTNQKPIDGQGTVLPSVIAGKYTAAGADEYALSGFGTAKIKKATKGDEFILIISPTEYTTQEYSVTVKKTAVEKTDVLYRLWRISKTRLRIDDPASIAADFNECNINEIDAFLRDNNIGHGFAIPEGSKVTGIDISALGVFTILYQNGKAAYAEWIHIGGENYRIKWNGSEHGLPFDIDDITVSYLDGCCLLSMSATLQSNKGTLNAGLTWMMVPAD